MVKIIINESDKIYNDNPCVISDNIEIHNIIDWKNSTIKNINNIKVRSRNAIDAQKRPSFLKIFLPSILIPSLFKNVILTIF